jgi:hypothetical protein
MASVGVLTTVHDDPAVVHMTGIFQVLYWNGEQFPPARFPDFLTSFQGPAPVKTGNRVLDPHRRRCLATIFL